jgi:hypothetical protein
MHHEKFTGCYGALGIVDWLHGNYYLQIEKREEGKRKREERMERKMEGRMESDMEQMTDGKVDIEAEANM